MRGASLLWFLFSAGGVATFVLIAAAWLWARPRSTAARVCLVCIAAGYGLLSLYPIPLVMAHVIDGNYHQLIKEDVPPGSSIVVLLGSGSLTHTDWSGQSYSVLDATGAERTLEAARVYHLIQPSWIVSSGGQIDPDDRNAPAAETMRDALVKLGVPTDRIIVERKSTDTRDQALTVLDLLGSLRVDHVILVTSRLHMRRAVGMFRAAGVETIPAVARDRIGRGRTRWSVMTLPSAAGLELTAAVAHEAAGLAYYRLRGWYR